MIVLQREFAEGRVSKFSSVFWRIIRRNKMFLTQVKRKENKLSPCINYMDYMDTTVKNLS